MKKALAILLMLVMVITLVACGPKEGTDTPDTPEGPKTGGETGGVEPFDWTHYDELIQTIKTTQDMELRRKSMHEAEDMLMETGAICPIYFYNDEYMSKPDLKDFYCTLYGYKYFEKASYGDKDTVRLNISSEPQYVDPALNTAVDGAVMAVNSFSGLFTYNDKLEIVPDCVETYEVSDDGLTYTFNMREGLKWSDGSPLDATDFEYSLKRAADPATGCDYRYMLDCIEGWPEDADGDIDKLEVKASEDGKVLTIKLKSVTAYFLDLCCFPTYFPVQKEAVESAPGYKDANGKIVKPAAWTENGNYVSNGPFKNTGWVHNQTITFEKNEHFHRADDVKLQKLEFMLSDDDTAIYAAYQAGDLDFIDSVPADEVSTLLENPEFHVIDQLGTYFVCFNVKSDMFAGKTVEEANKMRRALTVAIDRQYIVDTVGQTGQKLANTFIPPGMYDGLGQEFKQNTGEYKYPNEAAVGYFDTQQDLDLARQLLTEAGFKFGDDGKLSDETPLHVNYITNKSSGHEKIASIIYDDFNELGVTMTISLMDWDTTLAERKAGHYDVARHGWVADFNDPINMLEMWTTDSGNNDAQFGRFD
ncbi:MAG: ABC transporter substrate-binding protein [Saccharofermentanales bacterium]|jgi:oligopeptide transport system substrate-binding protein